jgi:serine/threonine protein kinase
LGKGHFATVRLARHTPSHRVCALKVIEHHAVASPRQHELFRREIAALQVG